MLPSPISAAWYRVALGAAGRSTVLDYGGNLLNQMRYLLSILVIVAGTIMVAKTTEVALDANGNTAKILISKDDFTIEDD